MIDQDNHIKIAICIITCLRPEGLTRLLKSLKTQNNINFQEYSIRIIVVDNDLTGQNDKIVQELSKNSIFPIKLTIEPKRGIPHARNKAVEEAWGEDAIIFIDDDEYASPNWLTNLLDTWEKTNGDIVTGPVTAKLPDNSPAWAVKSKTYDEIRNHKTGEEAHKAYTNNTLISQRVFHTITPAFDTFFQFSGSEDIHFFQKATKQGFKIYWCNEAIVYETIPQTRLNVSWLIKRSFRSGSGDTISRIRINPSYRIYTKVLIMGISRMIYGVFLVMKGILLLNWQYSMKGMKTFISGIGTYAGIFGITYNEYKIIHGS